MSAEFPVERPQFLEIQPTVQRRHVGRVGQPAHDRKVKLGDVEMNDVELARPGSHLLQHQHVRREMIPAGIALKSQSLTAGGDESG